MKKYSTLILLLEERSKRTKGEASDDKHERISKSKTLERDMTESSVRENL